jgi:diguanylate cyclase (GGDEF)-like protein
VDEASFVFRFGGEEMLVLLPGHAPVQVQATAERVRAAFEKLEIRHDGLGGSWVTASLGVASALSAESTLERLLQAADTALYEAKRLGRNRVAAASLSTQGARVA